MAQVDGSLQRKVAGRVGKEDRVILGWGVFSRGLLEDMGTGFLSLFIERLLGRTGRFS